MKDIITTAIFLAILILGLSGFSLTLRPFSFKIDNPWLALGIILIFCGISAIYWQGWLKGFDKGCQDTATDFVSAIDRASKKSNH